ncbi:syntaxin-41-like isoform X2 [Durio zibethinus]|uniref:Syntaxin-41-like isoform X2 n=1 Tax=Durio zibethinus TaxID=66656 RepID=A0A6P6B1C1_DURZI|nr:syntaxin-41-like isoform X2 [Durio zibethinus]
MASSSSRLAQLYECGQYRPSLEAKLASGVERSRNNSSQSFFRLQVFPPSLIFSSQKPSKPPIFLLSPTPFISLPIPNDNPNRFFIPMATRNRTLPYKKHRDALKSVRAPLSSSASGSGGPVIEMVNASFRHSNRSSYTPLSTEEEPGPSSGAFTVGFPLAWVDDSEEIAANIQRAKVKIAELAKAHSKALMPSFGDGKEDQRAIEVLTKEITDLLRKSEKRLRKFSSNGSSEDSNLRKNVQRSLATELQSLSVDLRRKQSTYLKRLQQQKEGQDGVELEMNLNENRYRLEDSEFSDVGFNEHQMSKLKESEFSTVEREREIAQVVKSVNELAQIMKDLSVLVIDQGTIVDRIDYNIQNVATSVEEGFKQLQKAERTQKKGGMVMCATVLVILCFIMIVLLILKEIFL